MPVSHHPGRAPPRGPSRPGPGRTGRLDVRPAARDWLARNGFDMLYGARPLRRLVQSTIGDQLARELLGGQVRDGDAVVVDTNEHGTGLIVGAAATRHI